jgi:hypothetical protein
MLIKFAQEIIAQKKSFVFPKVLVIDFPLQTAGINALSSFLADDLSAALDAKLPAGTMIPRCKLHEFLAAQDVSPLESAMCVYCFLGRRQTRSKRNHHRGSVAS